MREVKFRAWDKKKKKMMSFNDLLKPVDWEEASMLVLVLTESDFYGSENLELMQFTELLDKNGKEIYEGDIVQFPDTESEYVDVEVGMLKVAEAQLNCWGSVEFKNSCFGLNITMNNEGIGTGFFTWEAIKDYYSTKDLEVIGNIYKNKDLLKEKK